MRSVSPSAVIFGPMAAISAEGFLAEAGLKALSPENLGAAALPELLAAVEENIRLSR